MKTIPRREEFAVEVNKDGVISIIETDAKGQNYCIQMHAENAVRLADAIMREAESYLKSLA